MFREMRRIEKSMNLDEVMKRLDEASHGILCVHGDHGYPFGVPVSYSVWNDKIVVHCASEGHKIESIKKDEKVSFTIVLKDEIDQSRFTTDYESIVAYGRAKILDDLDDKKAALLTLIEKYSPDFIEGGKKYIQASAAKTCVLLVEIESITGKRSKK